MKKSGLKNRFSDSVRADWCDWYDCMVCKQTGCDVLHHIISPSSRLYVDGNHNASIYNSCPVHNHGCHVGNESYLYRDEIIKKLLMQTRITVNHYTDHVDNEIDKVFKSVYLDLYDEGIDDIIMW